MTTLEYFSVLFNIDIEVRSAIKQNRQVKIAFFFKCCKINIRSGFLIILVTDSERTTPETLGHVLRINILLRFHQKLSEVIGKATQSFGHFRH